MSLQLKHLPKLQALKELAKIYPDAKPDCILTIVRFMRVAGELTRVIETHFGRYELSQARFSILMNLYTEERKDGVTPSALAEELGVTRGNMTGLIDGLIDAGYICKEDDPVDRRIVKIKLSKKGRQYLEKILPDHFARTSKALSLMSKKEMELLWELLDKIEQGFHHLSAP